MSIPEPDRDCPLCPRLVAYRHANREACPDWHNAPAPPFGASDAWLLILGLAPGRTGANRTGRVFTGDAAGGFLFDTLLKTGLATGTYRADGHDDMQLDGCLISNAVLCAPPANRPTPGEENACRPHLTALLDHLASLEVIITLGDIARRNLLKALGQPASAMPPGHGATARLGRYAVINSYHCSRLNLNTGRLTADMFEAVLNAAGRLRKPSS